MARRTFDPDAFLRALWAMDDALVGAGFHRTPPWWRAEAERFVRELARGEHGAAGRRARRWIIRAGRRAGKSSFLCRLAVAWALWGPWHVPTGDIGVVAFVSVSRDEASSRIRTIADILTAVGQPFDRRDGEIELTGSRRATFKVFAATTKAVVGITAILVLGDEVSRWESRDSAANPAREVFGSLVPSLATQPYGFAVLSSSPWSTEDYHAELFDLGDNGHQVTSFGTTWNCNPTITEADTHGFEPHRRTWEREYAAIPSPSGGEPAIPPEQIQAVTCDELPDGTLYGETLCGVDLSKLRDGDRTVALWATWAYPSPTPVIRFRETTHPITGERMLYRHPDPGPDDFVPQLHAPTLRVHHVLTWRPEDGATLSDVARDVADQCHRYGCRVVFSDDYDSGGFAGLLSHHGVRLRAYAWSLESKAAAIGGVLRRMFRERTVSLPNHTDLVKELTAIREVPSPSGRMQYPTRGKDHASALIAIAHGLADPKVLGARTDARARVDAPTAAVAATRFEAPGR